MHPDMPEAVGDCTYASLLSIVTHTNDGIQTPWMISASSPERWKPKKRASLLLSDICGASMKHGISDVEALLRGDRDDMRVVTLADPEVVVRYAVSSGAVALRSFAGFAGFAGFAERGTEWEFTRRSSLRCPPVSAVEWKGSCHYLSLAAWERERTHSRWLCFSFFSSSWAFLASFHRCSAYRAPPKCKGKADVHDLSYYTQLSRVLYRISICLCCWLSKRPTPVYATNAASMPITLPAPENALLMHPNHVFRSLPYLTATSLSSPPSNSL